MVMDDDSAGGMMYCVVKWMNSDDGLMRIMMEYVAGYECGSI